jgi:hypothetical protein
MMKKPEVENLLTLSLAHMQPIDKRMKKKNMSKPVSYSVFIS